MGYNSPKLPRLERQDSAGHNDSRNADSKMSAGKSRPILKDVRDTVNTTSSVVADAVAEVEPSGDPLAH